MKKSWLFISLLIINAEVFSELRPLDEGGLEEVVVLTGSRPASNKVKSSDFPIMAGHEEFGIDLNIRNLLTTAEAEGYIGPALSTGDFTSGLPPGGLKPQESSQVIYTTTTTIYDFGGAQ